MTQVKLNVRDTQKVDLEMLIAFADFCDRHGLSYQLCGGTLLGAIRHKGFIPWDDDIDVFMPRPDYEKFLTLTAKEPLAANMAVANARNGLFVRPFSRIYYHGTHVTRELYNKESGAEVWMDILPVDGLPEDETKWRGIYLRRDFMSNALMTTMWNVGVMTRKMDYLRRPFFYVLGCFPMGKQKGRAFWCERMERLGKKVPYGSTKIVGCVTAGRYGKGEAMQLDDYTETTLVPFEGRMFKTMRGWKEYLTGIYGDYMKLPPENRRYPHLTQVTMDEDAFRVLCEKYPQLKAEHAELFAED